MYSSSYSCIVCPLFLLPPPHVRTHTCPHIIEKNGKVPEDVRTELRFLYSDCPQEILTNHPKLHVGIGMWEAV